MGASTERVLGRPVQDNGSSRTQGIMLYVIILSYSRTIQISFFIKNRNVLG